MKKVLAVVAIAVLTCSVAAAKVNSSSSLTDSRKVTVPEGTRTNGTLGSYSATAQQVGSLQVQVDVTCTTAGGDGVPFVGITSSGATITLNDQVMILGQIYDTPWAGGLPPGGANTFVFSNTEYFINSPVALNSFTNSFTTTVNVPNDYQVWAGFVAGLSWPTPAYAWGDITQGVSGGFITQTIGPVATVYVDASVPPTATPDPNAGGIPVPTMNQWGIAAMVILLIGVAMLIITRRQ